METQPIFIATCSCFYSITNHNKSPMKNSRQLL
jgi:hypothetical protein